MHREAYVPRSGPKQYRLVALKARVVNRDNVGMVQLRAALGSRINRALASSDSITRAKGSLKATSRYSTES